VFKIRELNIAIKNKSLFIMLGNTLQYFPMPLNTSAKMFFFVDFIVQRALLSLRILK